MTRELAADLFAQAWGKIEQATAQRDVIAQTGKTIEALNAAVEEAAISRCTKD